VKKLMLAVVLITMLLCATAYADSILFPYINSNPGNLSTIINIINTATPAILTCVDPNDALLLHYRYFTKPVSGTGSATTDICEEIDFSRPSTTGDLVTFDVTGIINSGKAMFGDATNYNLGGGAPNFDIPTVGGLTDARRGYLLVNHGCTVTGEIPGGTQGVAGDLDGEAILLDVVNGAAWGYRAVMADPTVVGDYAFVPVTAAAPVAGETSDFLPEWPVAAAIPFGVANAYAHNQVVAIYPPNDFQTRFFVTPLVISTDLSTNNDMSLPGANDQKRTRIRLLDRNGIVGVTDRDENAFSRGQAVHVRCVAGIDLESLTGALPAWFKAQGGWVQVDLQDPPAIIPPETGVVEADDHNAIVFKLEFGKPAYVGGSMINQSDLIRDGRILP
jgi:hypothetical protein